MKDTEGTHGHTMATTAHEAYAFACLHCGHAWEQAYEIEHHVDNNNRPFILYFADGERVPSPLTRLTCLNCGEHNVRIMRAGRANAALSAQAAQRRSPHP
ncbi:hypothetical protein [Streptomyces gobiensis]|uniref:hypothetical protein n=1 Tax=Streptomyces gobiensis TaxID=2875706 RepID=UPI003BB01878